MSHYALRVNKLWKEYRVSQPENARGTFYELLSRSIVPWRRPPGPPAADDRFWALRDVDFEVQPGEVMGIIGRNGAGKSTLLKILSRITAPTRGRIEIRGRLASLLEVGTGFHPELSGRENIYLNGAILGMRREEVARKFDEIVDFAEIDKFIDMPVKRYSSGMYVRLAFAVAAHLEADVLIVDEVLAVGDAQFQQRCLGKMQEVSSGGRTVLLVSHNMAAISRLCGRALLLAHGEVVALGAVAAVSTRYLTADSGVTSERTWPDASRAPGDATARLRAVRIRSAGRVCDVVDIRDDVMVDVEYELLKPADVFVGLTLFGEAGLPLFFTPNWSRGDGGSSAPRGGLIRATCRIPGNFLAEGLVKITAEISTRSPVYVTHALEHDSVAFSVVDSGQEGSVRAAWGGNFPGVVRPALKWTTGSGETP